MKPSGRPSPSLSGIISPLAQKVVPSLRRCQRSSLPRPWSRGRAHLLLGDLVALVLLGKEDVGVSPEHLGLGPPEDTLGPAFQLVTRPFRSIAMMP